MNKYKKTMAAADEMHIEEVKDKGGATLRLQVIDGRYYPTFPPSVIKNIPSLKIRPDDVILTGYLKSGTHWVWEILRMLLAGKVDIPNVEKDVAMIDQIDQVMIDALESPRVLNTHLLFEQLPTEVLKQKPRIVYCTRNPKDTAVSLYNHHLKLQEYYSYDGKFENYVPLFLEGKVDYGSWFDHIENWSRAVATHPDLKLLVVNYEDLIENAQEQIKEMAEFLGVSASPQLIEQIQHLCSLQEMKKRKGKFDLDSKGESIMYCKGAVGNWKSVFTDKINKTFDEVYEKKMKDIQTNFYWRFTMD